MLAPTSLTTSFRATVVGAVAFVALARQTGEARALDIVLPPVIGTSELVVSDWRNALALGGVDPVAYFTEGTSRFGRAEYEASWRGFAWRFDSAANRKAFESDPQSFSPRLGGYDALMATRGALVEGRAETFAIVAGRLYLFRTEANRREFEADTSLAAKAESRWGELRTVLSQD